MTNIKKWLRILGTVSVFSLTTSTVFAGSDDGTLRVALSGPVDPVDIFIAPGPQAVITVSAVFNPLVAYQSDSKQFTGVIAESWTQIDDSTVEFKIKPNLVFQDGSAL